MAKIMKFIAGAACILTLLSALIYYKFHSGIMLTFAITFGTIAYHFCMRLLIGLIYNTVMNNKADYTKKWFQPARYEEKLYRLLRVKKWKGKMPTYNSSFFDSATHTLDEIAQAMCQAELVHETIIVFSFLPIIASVWVGELPVFIITSVLAALFDSLFVIMQRYNRLRIVRLIERQAKKSVKVNKDMI